MRFYNEIIDKHLFRSDRKPLQDSDDDSTSVNMISGSGGSASRFVLYGTAVVGSDRLALVGYTVTDSTTKRRDEKVRMVKVGDSVGQMQVSDIQESSVTITGEGEEPIVLSVHEPKSPQTRQHNRTVSTTNKAPVAATRSQVRKRPVSRKQDTPPSSPPARN